MLTRLPRFCCQIGVYFIVFQLCAVSKGRVGPQVELHSMVRWYQICSGFTSISILRMFLCDILGWGGWLDHQPVLDQGFEVDGRMRYLLDYVAGGLAAWRNYASFPCSGPFGPCPGEVLLNSVVMLLEFELEGNANAKKIGAWDRWTLWCQPTLKIHAIPERNAWSESEHENIPWEMLGFCHGVDSLYEIDRISSWMVGNKTS